MINDIVRTKNIASRSVSIRFPIEDREVVYFEKVAAIFRAQQPIILRRRTASLNA